MTAGCQDCARYRSRRTADEADVRTAARAVNRYGRPRDVTALEAARRQLAAGREQAAGHAAGCLAAS